MVASTNLYITRVLREPCVSAFFDFLMSYDVLQSTANIRCVSGLSNLLGQKFSSLAPKALAKTLFHIEGASAVINLNF